MKTPDSERGREVTGRIGPAKPGMPRQIDLTGLRHASLETTLVRLVRTWRSGANDLQPSVASTPLR